MQSVLCTALTGLERGLNGTLHLTDEVMCCGGGLPCLRGTGIFFSACKEEASDSPVLLLQSARRVIQCWVHRKGLWGGGTGERSGNDIRVLQKHSYGHALVIYCCVTNDPEPSRIKQPFHCAHRFCRSGIWMGMGRMNDLFRNVWSLS